MGSQFTSELYAGSKFNNTLKALLMSLKVFINFVLGKDSIINQLGRYLFNK